jgi:hypothetical protein
MDNSRLNSASKLIGKSNEKLLESSTPRRHHTEHGEEADRSGNRWLLKKSMIYGQYLNSGYERKS